MVSRAHEEGGSWAHEGAEREDYDHRSAVAFCCCLCVEVCVLCVGMMKISPFLHRAMETVFLRWVLRRVELLIWRELLVCCCAHASCAQ